MRPMFWLAQAQTVQYDDPAFMSGETWSHYLYNIVIWAPGNVAGLEEQVRKALAGVDPNLVLYGVDPYSRVLSGDFQQEKMIATSDHTIRVAWAGAVLHRVIRGAGVLGGAPDK